MSQWNGWKVAESMGVIAIAFVLGNLIDQTFSKIFKKTKKNVIWRIVAQFMVIIGVIAFFETVDLKLLPKNITTNIFFITVFIGTQQSLLTSMGRVQFVPKMAIKDEE